MAGYPRAYFFFPPTNTTPPFAPSATYRLNDSLSVSWTSNFPKEGTNILLYCGLTTDEVPRRLAGPLSAPQNATLDNPYQFALTQDYGGPQGVCHFELTTVTPERPKGVFNGYGNNSGTFIVVNDADLRPVTWALPESTTSSLITSTPVMSTVVVSVTVGASSILSVGNSIKVPSRQVLSRGVKTGVSVGVVCGVLAAATLSWIVFWKRRRNTNRGAEVKRHLKESPQRLPQIVKEIPGVKATAELAATSGCGELDGVPLAEVE